MLFHFLLPPPPKRLNKKTQQGAVLIIALFIMALAAAMAYAMATRLQKDIRRTSLITYAVKGEYYAQGTITWAQAELTNNWNTQKPGQLIDKLPLNMPPQQVDDYRITCTIYDAQAKFNINNLASSADAQSQFERLVHLLYPQLKVDEITALAKAIKDWLTPGLHNNLDDEYAKQTPPYRAAHRPLQNINELSLVKGMTRDLLRGIKTVATALPNGVFVNVQTAYPLVLASLSPNLNLQGANQIAQARIKKPFITVQDFLDLEFIKNHNIKSNEITVISQYFLVETQAALDDQRIILYTLLARHVENKKAKVDIVWQSKNME